MSANSVTPRRHEPNAGRKAPICYTRPAPLPLGEIDQTYIHGQDKLALMAFSAFGIIAAFLIVYGGWGF